VTAPATDIGGEMSLGDIHLGIIVFVITCSALVILSNFINKYPQHHKVKNYNRPIDRTHSNVALASIAPVIKKA
jgi:1,4-dihydroxy-2-naphthoate octaprenyltransferase